MSGTQKWKNTTPTSIAITTPPAKVDYFVGDILDLTGIVVTAYYAGGSSKNITTECTFSPANGATLATANTSVTVTWRTFTATQAITVVSPTYGAEWDGTSNPAWTRTDLATNFVDPVPWYAGLSGSPSSPFDDIMPWSGMVRVTDAQAGELVAIPKFYYKLSQTTPGTGMKIQISPIPQDGFHVSPAHMNRGDGVGERDVVYVGRYHCRYDLTSNSGQTKVNTTRSDFRIAIHNLGSDIWQMDFATRFTIWLLYIVEFAHWNSQLKIGYGCGNNSTRINSGYTDSMVYHTGTTLALRTDYGLGTQYRNIEGLWDNIYDWLDGCYNNSSGLNIILNPENFSDNTGGTLVGIPTVGIPSQFTVEDVNGTFPLFIPTESNGSDSTYSCDNWSFGVSSPCPFAGGNYYQNLYNGLFFVGCTSTTNTTAYNGSRIMKLPSA